MPFRDRVARRFGETVSALDSDLYPDSDYFMTSALSLVHNVLPTPPYTPNHYSNSNSILNNHDQSQAIPPSDPRSGTGRGRAARHGRKKDVGIVGSIGQMDREKKELGCKALGSQYHGLDRVTKSIKNKSHSHRSKRPGGRRFASSTASSTVHPRSARLASHRNSVLYDFLNNGRQYGTRVTRASSRLTDANGKQLSPTSPYLSYHDVCLTYEDIKALRNDWLTDNNIAFWEEWLEREILPKYPQARICLLRPSMTYLLMREAEPRQLRPALPDMTKVTHVFLPINDAVSRTQPDGSHWSLLLVSKIDGVAFHYDSLGGANNMDGVRATDQLGKLLGMSLRYHAIMDSPQQENGNDCGVFVCILMRHLLVKRLLNANAREQVSMSMSNKMIDAGGARKEMIKIIESLRKEGERRRSASPNMKMEGAPRID